MCHLVDAALAQALRDLDFSRKRLGASAALEDQMPDDVLDNAATVPWKRRFEQSEWTVCSEANEDNVSIE